MGNTDVVKKEDIVTTTVFNSEVRQLTEEEKIDLGITDGLKITKVGDGKFRNIGIKSGFVITKIDNKEFSNPKELQAYLEKHQGRLLIQGLYSKNQVYSYSIGY